MCGDVILIYSSITHINKFNETGVFHSSSKVFDKLGLEIHFPENA